jgi:integrase
VDFEAEEVRLDAGTTKNGEGRVFPFTAELRRLLQERQAEHERLKKARHIVPWVFVRMVAKGRRGPREPERIYSSAKSWKAACMAAGVLERILHDFRRTAVRNLVRAAIPERVAMTMTGHKTRSVFEAVQHRQRRGSEGRSAEARRGSRLQPAAAGTVVPTQSSDVRRFLVRSWSCRTRKLTLS